MPGFTSAAESLAARLQRFLHHRPAHAGPNSVAEIPGLALVHVGRYMYLLLGDVKHYGPSKQLIPRTLLQSGLKLATYVCTVCMYVGIRTESRYIYPQAYP